MAASKLRAFLRAGHVSQVVLSPLNMKDFPSLSLHFIVHTDYLVVLTFILCHQCTKYKQEMQGLTLINSLDDLWFVYFAFFFHFALLRPLAPPLVEKHRFMLLMPHFDCFVCYKDNKLNRQSIWLLMVDWLSSRSSSSHVA